MKNSLCYDWHIFLVKFHQTIKSRKWLHLFLKATTSLVEKSKGLSYNLNQLSLNVSNNRTMAMFIRLLAIKIVAKSFLGRFNNLWTISNFFEAALFSSALKSVGVSEKKATSAPDINAEQSSKTTSVAIPGISV